MKKPTPKLIYEFSKNASELIRVQLTEYNGRLLLDLRVWVLKDGGDYIPTKKGITIRPEQVDSLKEAIDKAVAEIEKDEND